jgi:hypothetical protein
MSGKKPTPVISDLNAKKCPVCGQRSYSWAGIHPQCAMVLADAPRKLGLAAQRKAAAQTKAKIHNVTLAFWEKICPRCRARLPARKPVCVCGHRFTVS